MNGLERRKEILALLGGKGSLAVGELAEALAVSKMTIHRDLETLAEQGLVKKIHGGAVACGLKENRPTYAIDREGGSHAPERTDKNGCLMCFRPVTPHLLYSITFADGNRQFACCPHCGLWAQLQKKDQITMTITTDFLSGRPHPAQSSFFLLNSGISPCCRPSILTFDDRELASRFQTGFGGLITGMGEALEFLQSEMTLGPQCPHCSG